MARKFGKQVEVSNAISDYMIGIMAPSGFGKTTLMYQVCEKQFGPEGYIILDAGQENGVAALQGAVAERVTTWKKLKEVVDDIVANKETDYQNLKVVVFDTLDATFDIAESYTVKEWNSLHHGEQGFKPAASINGVEGGFGRGMDAVINNVKKEIIKLHNVGVNVWWTAHVKEKDQADLYSGVTYTTLTANMSMKYFSAIKNSSHIVAFGYFDRNIEKQQIGDANPITKKKKERSSVIDELRKIKFRDDALVADAKCRFSNIIDEINLNANDFIKAITDAIKSEQSKVVQELKVPVVQSTSQSYEESNDDDADTDGKFDEGYVEVEVDNDIATKEALLGDIRDKFKLCTDKEIKAHIKEIIVANGFDKLSIDLSLEVLEQIIGLLN